MSVDSVLNNALTGFGLPVYPNDYTGPDTEYLTWSYAQIPTLDADDAPHAARYLITVRYYLPRKKNPNTTKNVISLALYLADCTLPSITDISDAEGQAYAFECEYVDGGALYGDA